MREAPQPAAEFPGFPSAYAASSPEGRLGAGLSCPHTSEGLNALVAFVAEGEITPEPMLIGIEVNHGAAVEALLASALPVCAINPKLLDRLRDRFSALIEKAPSPSLRGEADSRQYRRGLEGHRIRRLTIEDVHTVLRKDVLSLRPVYIQSHVARVLVLTAKLKLAQTQIDNIEKRIKTDRRSECSPRRKLSA